MLEHPLPLRLQYLTANKINNHTALWKFEPVPKEGENVVKIVNSVTQKSQDPTYMQLGTAIDTNPETYKLSLKVS